MSTTEERRRMRKELGTLLERWYEVERWIKRAEHVNKKAVIPAINELRYAARQVIHAIKVISSKKPLNEGEINSVRRRIILTRQFIMNAEHDICDAIASFYKDVIDDLDRNIPVSIIQIYYPGYVEFRKNLQDCLQKIQDSRRDQDDRINIYEEIRTKYLGYLIEEFQNLQEAHIQAQHQQKILEDELRKKDQRNKISLWFGYISGFASLVSVPLSIYFWQRSSDAVCTVKDPDMLARLLC